MEYRKLGQSDITVAPLALGTNVFGWTIDEQTSHSLLDQFVAGGFNLIDTADVYSTWVPGNSGGESETIIGNWLKKTGLRDKVIIATKVGSDMGNGKKGLSASYIHQAVDASLKRLQTDYIDLYQSHKDDPETPVEETLEAYSSLVRAGKVRIIGASNFTAARLEASLEASKQHGYPAYQTLQPEYNLYERGYEETLAQICSKAGISVISYYSLASGFLTGKYRSEDDLRKSQRGGGVKKYLNDRGFRILSAIDKVAAAHNATPASVSLAWLMAKPAVAAPIASATSTRQLKSLIASADLILGSDDVQLLDDAGRQ